jgi:hypothetical protein
VGDNVESIKVAREDLFKIKEGNKVVLALIIF